MQPLTLLVLGGTRFLGRFITEAALADGHQVTLFNRGRTAPGLFPAAETVLGDRAESLSALPYVDFGPSLHQDRPDGIHWKTPHLLTYAAARPFAWLDDEQSQADHTEVTARHPAPSLLHHVNPRLGPRDPDFAALAAFSG